MMEGNNIDKFSKKLFDNYSMAKLPGDFTEKLMIKMEQDKIVTLQTKPLFSKKFLVLFLTSFLSIFAIGFFMNGSVKTNETTSKIAEKIKLPDYDLGKILEFFNFNIEISLFVKLFVISIVVLLVIDILSGSVIDYFLDSKAKKEGT